MFIYILFDSSKALPRPSDWALDSFFQNFDMTDNVKISKKRNLAPQSVGLGLTLFHVNCFHVLYDLDRIVILIGMLC